MPFASPRSSTTLAGDSGRGGNAPGGGRRKASVRASGGAVSGCTSGLRELTILEGVGVGRQAQGEVAQCSHLKQLRWKNLPSRSAAPSHRPLLAEIAGVAASHVLWGNSFFMEPWGGRHRSGEVSCLLTGATTLTKRLSLRTRASCPSSTRHRVCSLPFINDQTKFFQQTLI